MHTLDNAGAGNSPLWQRWLRHQYEVSEAHHSAGFMGFSIWKAVSGMSFSQREKDTSLHFG